jgi:hypothetical protein
MTSSFPTKIVFATRNPQATELPGLFCFVQGYSTKIIRLTTVPKCIQSKKGKLFLLLIKTSVKINRDYYIELFLGSYLLEHAKNLHGEDFIFVSSKILHHLTMLTAPRTRSG